MALFGITPPKKAEPAAQVAPVQDGPVFDVSGTRAFEEQVLRVSMEKPVLVDFWAPWCGPCKQLMPVLEAEVQAANGDVLLAKVNIDDNPDIAQALRIQSVPTVMAFFQGQPVTGFAGARPASEIRNLIAQLVKLARSAMPDAIDIPSALKSAAELLSTDPAGAQALYMQVLSQDQTNIDAYNGLVRVMIEADALDQAEDLVSNAPELIAKNPGFAASRTALDLAKGAKALAGKLGPLQKAAAADPGDHQARFDLAAAQFAAGQKAEAIDNLLEIIRRDRSWKDDAARLELLRYFEAMGFADPLSVEGRKKLSRVLFS